MRLDATLKQFFTVAGESDFEQAKKAALAGAGANPATNEGLARWFGCLRHYGLPDDAEAAIAELADLNNTIEEAARRALIACDAHLKATRASIDSMSKICSSMDRWTEVTRGQADKTCETLAGVKAESLKLAELTSKTAEAWRETLVRQCACSTSISHRRCVTHMTCNRSCVSFVQSLAKFADNEIQLFLMGALANEIARCQAQTALLAVRRAALEAYGRAWKEKDSLEFQQKKYREKSDEARAAQLEPKIAEATRLTRQMKERLDDVTKGILHVEATAAAAKRVQMLTVAFGSFATTQIASGNNSHDIWGGFLSKAGIDREEAIKKAQSIIDAKQDDEEFRVILATAPTMGPAPRTRKEGDDDDSAFGAAAAAAAAAAASAPAPAAAAAASSRAAGDEEGDMM